MNPVFNRVPSKDSLLNAIVKPTNYTVVFNLYISFTKF